MSAASLPHGVRYYLHDLHRGRPVKRRYGERDEKYSGGVLRWPRGLTGSDTSSPSFLHTGRLRNRYVSEKPPSESDSHNCTFG